MRKLSLPLFALMALAPLPAAAGPLVADAGMARYALAADEALFLAQLDPSSRAVFESAIGDDFGAAGGFWSDIMAGALQLRREDGDTAEVLWFNPVFEAGLASRWQREGERWHVIAAVPVTGETLRGEPALPVLPGWMDSDGLALGLASAAAAIWPAAQAADWFGADSTGAGSVAITRVLLARTALAEMTRAPGFAAARGELRAWLVGRSDATLPPPLRDALARIGSDARLTLRPVSALYRAEGWTVTLQSPDAPRIAWLAHFGIGADGTASTLAFETVDLGSGQ